MDHKIITESEMPIVLYGKYKIYEPLVMQIRNTKKHEVVRVQFDTPKERADFDYDIAHIRKSCVENYGLDFKTQYIHGNMYITKIEANKNAKT